jgi:acyl-coenzyme A thioesterase PaaI-like protein
VFLGAPAAEQPTSEHADAVREQFFSRFDGRCTLPGRLHDIIGLAEDVGPNGEQCWTMPIGPTSRNGYGGLHGGVAFDLVTEAAAGSATAAVGAVEAKSALLRYLAPANIGPFRALPTVLPQEDGSVFVRVEVRDLGADSKLCILGEVHLAARR